MFKLGSLLAAEPSYQSFLKGVEAGQLPLYLSGLSVAHKAHYLAQISEELKRPMLVITEDEGAASRLMADINLLLGEGAAEVFVSREYTFRGMEGISREYEHARIAALTKFLEGGVRLLIAGAEAAVQYTIPEKVLVKETVQLSPGETADLKELSARLIQGGYTRYEQVTGVSEFAVRGGILDVFPPGAPQPIRVEFWGDEVDSIHYFDLVSQRRTEALGTLLIPPVSEVVADSLVALGETLNFALESLPKGRRDSIWEHFAGDIERFQEGQTVPHMDRYLPLVYPQPVTILSYFEKEGLLIFSESANIRERLSSHRKMHTEEVKALFSEGILFKGLDHYYCSYEELVGKAKEIGIAILDTFQRSMPEVPLRKLIEAKVQVVSPWGGEMTILEEDVDHYLKEGRAVVVLAGTEKSAQNVANDLKTAGYPSYYSNDAAHVKPGQVCLLEGTLSSGMDYPGGNFVIISHLKQMGRTGKKKKKKEKNAIRNLSDLVAGDYVVHSSHGIGVFDGIHQLETEGLIKDYIKIRYAGADTLYVPVTQLDLVSKYIGPREGGNVRLNKLNSGQWEKTKSRVKKAVAEMAEELIALYSKRLHAKGHAFSEDSEWQREFEEHFPYEETEDQLSAVLEIKRDMERSAPMDRLLCGDVGFGKTEVALRAAFKCISDGLQCAFLVPTTILAWQHYRTLIQRFDGFPVQIALLSRFRTPKQRAETIQDLRKGSVDIVIGTHRLVQKDVVFKRLGLAIIDEEQRFGVRHKEQFKEMASNVDVLTLSATPIPRTLNMALSGIRDMSVLEEPPQDRQPVQTYVLEQENGVLWEAIRRELKRDGQVYYLHNRVEDMEKVVLSLQKALPEASIGFAHGRMGEEELSEVWRRLLEHEIDILVCTTIIETGVDVPNVNTLIIEDADRMGLAQLYQIRGRVGRSTRRAYAYLTFRRGKMMTEEATKRLTAIKEFTNFGAGFQIAMRDLEIRGAGGILSATQHGHMESVGYDMYLRLLNEAVAEEKGEKESLQGAEECLIDVRVEAFIPKDYILGLSQRLDIYRRIASIQNEEDSRDVLDELIDRFGEPPRPVEGLIEVALLRGRAAALGIREITQTGSSTLQFWLEHLDMERVGGLIQKMRGRVLVNAGAKPYLALRLQKGEGILTAMQEVLAGLQEAPQSGKEQSENKE